jgi:NADPH:quinone reductase
MNPLGFDIAVGKEDLCQIPDGVDDGSAAGIPVAYLAAQVALTLVSVRVPLNILRAPTPLIKDHK